MTRACFNIAGFAFALAAVLLTLPGFSPSAPSSVTAESGKTSRLVRTTQAVPAAASDDLAAVLDRASPGAG